MKIVSLDSYGKDLPEQKEVVYGHPKLAARLRSIIYSDDNNILTDLERKAIILHIYESRDLIRCAGILHVSRKGVKDAVSRGIEKLKSRLK